ncbi:FMN-dependent NADH-azoreductase [Stackebrandtia nassauensis]|uniref:FMN dependent NADH:quinone oxidoreductase n=1 Tax=Stackebrandtia nassauensis (strain DSM 44728 / CIP 108903 / NRRL B-16338 / NBRC 102104 / LLR-40K-21) TaxID=446470 RepID=D3Q637_STANL|nr:NAD(P)H-dependent oxidoreductase [Stackebrandtia nassauensis]ADD42212.1 NAD(P)H dehydrogenase (quinone) [Stackebrandtia nassauensis DSM 44728]
MSVLLHVDSSINGDNSHSRKVTATFAKEWQAANPQGRYIYRDVAADPIPHIDAVTYGAINSPESEHTPEQAEAFGPAKHIIDEVVAADTILLGVPMYNFSVPSHLKAWMDRIAIGRFFADDDGKSELSDKKFVIATSRGGSYAPGTPRHHFDHQEPYLERFFEFLGAKDLTFLHTEMALSHVVPALAQFKHIYDETHAEAHKRARDLATA